MFKEEPLDGVTGNIFCLYLLGWNLWILQWAQIPLLAKKGLNSFFYYNCSERWKGCLAQHSHCMTCTPPELCELCENRMQDRNEWKVPCNLAELAVHINRLKLMDLTCQFLHNQLYSDGPPANQMALEECPEIHTKISIFSSASATFYAPSDESGIQGMQCKCIWST